MNKSYLKNGYYLRKSLCDVSLIRPQIEEIFQKYSKSNKPLDALAMDLFKNDFDGFLGCAHACQSLLDLTAIASSVDMISMLKSFGLKSPIFNTKPLLSFSSKFTAKNENYWKTPPHQDWPSTQGSINGLTCWIPLVDVTEELGPLEMSPYSHLNGPLPHTEVGSPKLISIDNFEYVSLPMNAGDAVFFSNFTVHRSGNNITEDKIRLSLHIRYDDAFEETFSARKFPKQKIEVRRDGNSLPEFPINELRKFFNVE